MQFIIPDQESIPYLTGEKKAYITCPDCKYYEVDSQPERLNPEASKKIPICCGKSMKASFSVIANDDAWYCQNCRIWK